MLIVDNQTTHQVGVYFIERASHVRLGTADPQSEARMPVRRATLNGRNVFRVYAFRGQEPCPVARLIDITSSQTPRMIVTATDTVMSAYLPADGCIRKSATPR